MLLDKKEIALRHTNQAIKMFFHKEDPVSTLVVACAANHILHALVCKKGLPVLLGYKGLFEKILIKEEYQKEENNYINKEKTYVPSGVASDLVKEGQEYDELIASLGGIDLQLLGIGLDGHIGFNEPDSVFTAETHPVDLDESTIDANARFFASRDDVPRQAITMGMKSIMQAKKILLIANGQNKKDVLEKAFSGPVDPMIPASILQLHPDVTVIFAEN